MLYCPCCGTEYKCPCKACKPMNNSKWKFLTNRKLELIRCKCGFDETMDWWGDLELKVYKLK